MNSLDRYDVTLPTSGREPDIRGILHGLFQKPNQDHQLGGECAMESDATMSGLPQPNASELRQEELPKTSCL